MPVNFRGRCRGGWFVGRSYAGKLRIRCFGGEHEWPLQNGCDPDDEGMGVGSQSFLINGRLAERISARIPERVP